MAAWKVISKYLGGQRVLCASIGLLLMLPATGWAQAESQQEVIVGENGEIYGNATAQRLVQEAKKFDPIYSPREQRNRDKAALLYEQAMDAQPGAKYNAVLANRIAQLYATYADKEKKVAPIPGKAVQWWTRCLELTNPKQLLWAQAQMGLACTATIKRKSKSALSAYDKILQIDANQIELEDWKYWPKSDQYKVQRERDRERLQKRVAALQVRVAKKKSSAEKRAKLFAQRKAARKEKPTAASWTLTKGLTVVAWVMFIALLVGIIIVKRRKVS